VFIVVLFFQFTRLRHAGYRVSRPPNVIGRYKMIRHEKQAPAVNRYFIFDCCKTKNIYFLRYGALSKWLRYSYDGVRQLTILDYSIVRIDTRSLYTHILVNFTRSATKSIDHLLDDIPKAK
jgi:hypothetical protein